MLSASASKLREPVAALLLAAVALYVLVSLFQLFGAGNDFSFSENAFLLGGQFVAPAWILVVVVAAALVSAWGEPSRHARLLVLVGMGILGLMALLALIAWLFGLAADTNGVNLVFFGGGKVAKTFLFLAGLAVLLGGLLLLFLLYRSLPAPVRQRAPQPSWDGTQWGGQPQWGASQQVGGWQAPGAEGAPPGQPWPSQAPQQSWGQPGGPQPAPPASPQPGPPAPPPQQPPSTGGATAAGQHPGPPPDAPDEQNQWWPGR